MSEIVIRQVSFSYLKPTFFKSIVQFVTLYKFFVILRLLLSFWGAFQEIFRKRVI